jgi:hypothetical protein
MLNVALLVSLAFLLSACGARDSVLLPQDMGGDPITWGPRLGTSRLSPVSGAEDDFGPNIADAVARAARAVPSGASQSSLAEDGQTADETLVGVVRDGDGTLMYEVTDGARWVVRVPSPPRIGFSFALFTDMPPGIEPDLSSFPHELLGMWAWNGDAGAFWSRSPSIPPVEFGAGSPTGTATYEGDAVGLHSGNEAVTKFLADVEMVADFDAHTVGGAVDRFRSLTGKALDDLSVNLAETGFSPQGDPFSGETTSAVAGIGQWGARWSDGEGRTMGGTFGFAADDGSVAVLGAFSACSCASADDGNPDDPVATPR